MKNKKNNIVTVILSDATIVLTNELSTVSTHPIKYTPHVGLLGACTRIKLKCTEKVLESVLNNRPALRLALNMYAI